MKKKTHKKSPAKRSKNASLVGSVVESLVPLSDMQAVARGAKADLKRLGKAITGRRNGKKQKRNPDDLEGSEQLYEEFHGRAATTVKTFVDREIVRSEFAGLGRLVSLVIVTLTGYKATIEFDKPDAPLLSSSPDGRQLYIIGGDQSVNLAAFQMDSEEWIRDRMVLGVIKKLTYHTRKGFHNFEPINYWHPLGEETGVEPFLNYDTLNRSLEVAGGQYRIKPEGIVN